MSPVRIGKEGTNRRGFVKNMAAGAGGYTLAAFQTEPDRKKKSSDGAGLTKIARLASTARGGSGKRRAGRAPRSAP